MEQSVNSQVYIPIPHYPPFKLRSSLIDKDPVIWVHLLEAYIKLIKYLLQNDIKILTFKSFQQLIKFLKVYLHETSLESSRIFSLGAINPEIKSNTAILRIYVFQFLKSFGILRFIEDSNDDGEMIWNFISIYIKNNASIVKSLLNYDSIISKLQNYLNFKILNNEFSKLDEDNFILLMDPQLTKVTKFTIDHTNGIKASKAKPKSNNNHAFSSSFVNSHWIKLLENLFSTIYKDTSKDLMIISMLSIPLNRLVTLVKDDLSIKSLQNLKHHPLFSSILISDQILDYFPNLSQRLPLLNNIKFKGDENADIKVNEDDVFTLIDLFPTLSQVRAKALLIEHDQNVEALTNLLLEDPSIIEEVVEKQPSSVPSSSTISHRSLYDDDKISKLDFSDTTVILGKKQRKVAKLDKKNLLISSLKLLYDDGEDEPDDTYDDQEITTGIDSRSNTPAPQQPQVDATELYLFGKYKARGEQAFEKSARKSPERQEIKTHTKWSDEQIEGWYKMLLKSPHRFKILDDIFFFENPNKPANRPDNREENATPDPTGGRAGNPTPPANAKHTNARNEKNKAAKGNHNRKTQHNKKAAIELKGLRQ